MKKLIAFAFTCLFLCSCGTAAKEQGTIMTETATEQLRGQIVDNLPEDGDITMYAINLPEGMKYDLKTWNLYKDGWKEKRSEIADAEIYDSNWHVYLCESNDHDMVVFGEANGENHGRYSLNIEKASLPDTTPLILMDSVTFEEGDTIVIYCAAPIPENKVGLLEEDTVNFQYSDNYSSGVRLTLTFHK